MVLGFALANESYFYVLADVQVNNILQISFFNDLKKSVENSRSRIVLS